MTVDWQPLSVFFKFSTIEVEWKQQTNTTDFITVLANVVLRYDVRCYFDVQSKADTSWNQQLKSGKQKN